MKPYSTFFLFFTPSQVIYNCEYKQKVHEIPVAHQNDHSKSQSRAPKKKKKNSTTQLTVIEK